MWRIGRAPNGIPIYSYIQQDATLHTLFISGNYSTCFGWYFHPSSGAHTTIYSIWYLSQHRYCYLPLSWKSWNQFECAVGGICHPQDTQTSTNSSTIATGSSHSISSPIIPLRNIGRPQESFTTLYSSHRS
jgi:hypothetical protein